MTGFCRPTRLRRAGLMLAAATIGAGIAPAPAGADGPGYGGTADALTVMWQSGPEDRTLAMYAVGFRSGSAVRVQVGSDAEQVVNADPFGSVDLVLAAPATAVPSNAVTGTSVLVSGQSPAGGARTLVGAVPPRVTASGATELVPWAVALAGLLLAGLWLRRANPSLEGLIRAPGRHRHLARHRG
ncbi:MAG TPA: hypothetical protein VN408_12990 [Actinoplanes sp.]|nr:hypothetical protein [Actinoplanes sp.]